jgi:hypothetical protein
MENQTTGLEIIDYSLKENSSSEYYENHIFTVRIYVGQFMYAIERSYSSFCEFHNRITRIYPKIELIDIPLSDVKLFKNCIKSKHKTDIIKYKKNEQSIHLRESMISTEDIRLSVVEKNKNNHKEQG